MINSEEKRKLNIWLIKEGETLPIGGEIRLMRTGALAKYLAEQGHTVTWWSSTFLHGEKKYIYNTDKKIKVQERERIILLHSYVSYKKNVSLRRIAYYKNLEIKMRIAMEKECVPDVILCAWPTAEFARCAVDYGKKHNVPVVIDIRDLWPDYFLRIFPGKMKKVGEKLIIPLKWNAKRTLKQGNAFVGVTESALDWLHYYTKPAKEQVILIGGRRNTLSKEELKKGLAEWEKLGVTEQTWNVCIFSSLGKQGDFETVIRAVKRLSKQYPQIRLVIGGKGDDKGRLEEIAAGSANILFAGWLNEVQMRSLMSICRCGAYSVKNADGFKDAFGNKIVQYLSEGLPVINSLTGFAARMLKDYNAGITYREGDVEDCTRKIHSLLIHEDQRRIMGENAGRLFSEKLDENIVNAQFMRFLQEVIHKKDFDIT